MKRFSGDYEVCCENCHACLTLDELRDCPGDNIHVFECPKCGVTVLKKRLRQK